MSSIGHRLKTAREDKGLTLVDVSEKTKIAVHHISALEFSDFRALPDLVHVKGYVRAYSEYLGLEPTSVLEEFQQEYLRQLPERGGDPRDETVRKMSKMLGVSRSPWARFRLPALVVAALAILAVLVWGGLRWWGPGDETGAVVMTDTRAADEPIQQPEPVVVETVESEEADATAAEPIPSPAASTSHLSITRFGVGTGVENRRLVGESDSFAVGTKVAFFTWVNGGSAGETIRHVWSREGAEIASIPLRLGSASWRTYSLKTMFGGSRGVWTVEAVDEAGNVLASSEFDCTP